MKSPEYLIDSNILIDHLNGIKKSTEWLSRVKDGQAVISVITYAEVLSGNESQSDSILYLLQQFGCLSIELVTAELAGRLRNAHSWKLPDAFQAALAIQHRLTLITRDQRAFKDVRNPAVRIPYILH
ncbi:MAG: PIN domain-containing protein [Candidatus Omnitrophica bacterium]|nr:PIN domain-containing protein [Candidatus Omnitrophota bacterium]